MADAPGAPGVGQGRGLRSCDEGEDAYEAPAGVLQDADGWYAEDARPMSEGRADSGHCRLHQIRWPIVVARTAVHDPIPAHQGCRGKLLDGTLTAF
ncbi:hypothetical protein ADK90_18990 [Streptomyces sp. XY413]|nr:hypothetical protein ADK90_18990 [Streptomyces sp. XY413]